MEEVIRLVFEELRSGDLTLNKAEKHLLHFYQEEVEKYVTLGKREVLVGEEKGFPLMGEIKKCNRCGDGF